MSNNLIPALSIGQFGATSVGLIVADGPAPAFEIWLTYGRALRRVKGALKFVLGDWLNFGEAAYGEKYSQALTLWPESNYGSLANTAYVCSNVDISCRHENLTFEHHYTVAKLDPDKQKELLDLAEENDWTVSELRKHRDIDIEGFSTERHITCPECRHVFPIKGATYTIVEVSE